MCESVLFNGNMCTQKCKKNQQTTKIERKNRQVVCMHVTFKSCGRATLCILLVFCLFFRSSFTMIAFQWNSKWAKGKCIFMILFLLDYIFSPWTKKERSCLFLWMSYFFCCHLAVLLCAENVGRRVVKTISNVNKNCTSKQIPFHLI